MEIKVLEKKPKKLKLGVLGETHTFLNLITEYSWLAKASRASYILRHPYLSEPELIVGSSNPKKTLRDAAQIIMSRTEDFKRVFNRALKN